MAGITILNGPFGCGKTELKHVLSTQIAHLDNSLPILTAEDGPHLVHQIREVAHGNNGLNFSSNHHHNWITKTHNHQDHPPESHFPFTVVDLEVSKSMFGSLLNELWEYRQSRGIVITELGTGLAGNVVGNPDFSTGNFLQVAKEKPYWQILKPMIVGIITLDTSWHNRTEHNPNRPIVADGISQSWELQLGAMNITRHSDFEPWKSEFSADIIMPLRNDFRDFDETKIRRIGEALTRNNSALGEGNRGLGNPET